MPGGKAVSDRHILQPTHERQDFPWGRRIDSAVEQVRENGRVVFDAAQGWSANGSTSQLSPMLNLLQEPDIVFGQTVRLGALPQQREITERWGVVVFIAFSH